MAEEADTYFNEFEQREKYAVYFGYTFYRIVVFKQEQCDKTKKFKCLINIGKLKK